MAEIALLLFLILLNGIFAMSEIALVSARRPRLQQLAGAGQPGAERALALSADPTRFLSTVQVGITSIGILSGAVGESAIAIRVQAWLERVPALTPYAEGLSLAVMVVTLTYVSLIVGELVPKRLGLTSPERIAALVAGPMSMLASVGRPLVFLLTTSTNFVLRILRVSPMAQSGTSDEEVKLLMAQGTEEGVFAPAEQALVANVLHLDDRYVGAILTPRSDVVFLDVTRPWEENVRTLEDNPHTVLPVCRGSLDDVIGFVRSATLLGHVLRSDRIDLERLASPASFVPRSVTLMTLLQQFKQSHLPVALVVDEFGGINGLVSLTDVTAAIVGELPETAGDDPSIVRRDDGSVLAEGTLEVSVLAREVSWLGGAFEDEGPDYHTLGGFAMFVLGRVPRTGDQFERAGARFEIVDMDGHRVDRVLVTRLGTIGSTTRLD
ncbi:MAG TPA: hemolysin family protein [Luteitalea sp.]|nr:hemolysin family protein [Luteitalea sp.]